MIYLLNNNGIVLEVYTDDAEALAREDLKELKLSPEGAHYVWTGALWEKGQATGYVYRPNPTREPAK